MRIGFFALVFLFFAISPSFASAQVVIPANVAKNIESWIGIPAEYLASPRDIIIFAVIPFVIAWMLVHGLWKEIGVINNETLDSWIPPLLVFASFQLGFFKFIQTLYANTQSLIFGGVAIFAYLTTAKIRQRVTSFGYSGIFSGLIGYFLDAVGVGLFFGGVAGVFIGGRLGPIVYAAFSAGAALGIFLIWWNKRGKKSGGQLKILIDQEEGIEKQIAQLERKRDELYNETIKMTKPEDKAAKFREMAMIQQEIEILKAERGVVETGMEKAA